MAPNSNLAGNLEFAKFEKKYLERGSRRNSQAWHPMRLDGRESSKGTCEERSFESVGRPKITPPKNTTSNSYRESPHVGRVLEGGAEWRPPPGRHSRNNREFSETRFFDRSLLHRIAPRAATHVTARYDGINTPSACLQTFSQDKTGDRTNARRTSYWECS